MKINLFKNIILTFLILLFIQPISSCKKIDTTEEVPNCIKRKIRKNIRKYNTNLVESYDYKGGKIYVLHNGHFDAGSLVYDENCNLICIKDTGFSNSGDSCLEIFKDAINGKIIWEN